MDEKTPVRSCRPHAACTGCRLGRKRYHPMCNLVIEIFDFELIPVAVTCLNLEYKLFCPIISYLYVPPFRIRQYLFISL